jgi:hypothetical protein
MRSPASYALISFRVANDSWIREVRSEVVDLYTRLLILILGIAHLAQKIVGMANDKAINPMVGLRKESKKRA